MILNSIALALYGIGYMLWVIESIISPDKRRNPAEWYGFISTKTQFILASVVGLIATGLGIAAIFFPILLIPACWLFTLSNLCWLLGEHQKTEHPPDSEIEPNYQPARQNAYFQYVLVVSLVSLASTIITTVSIFFPPFLWIALFIGPYLGGMVIKAWYDVNFRVPPEVKSVSVATSTSYENMNELMPGNADTLPPVPNCSSIKNPVTSASPGLREEHHVPSSTTISGIDPVAAPQFQA